MLKAKTNNRFKQIGLSERGNLAIILTVSIAMVFAVGGFAIDTALYLNKRQEVQSLAEAVATAAAHHFPLKKAVDDSAKEWFEKLRKLEGKIIAPNDAMTLVFNDNEATANDINIYKLDSLTVNINVVYTPATLPSGGSLPGSINILGSATAQLAPTDVMMVIENSASFYDPSDGIVSGYDPFNDLWGASDPRTLAYGAQCFNKAWTAFKKAAISAYDLMSQIGTFRVGIVTTNSHAGAPFLLKDISLDYGWWIQLPSQDSKAFRPVSRCAALTGAGGFPVPDNQNKTAGVWTPRTDLTTTINPDFQYSSFFTLYSGRELIWLLNAGYSNEVGYIHPKHYYTGQRKDVFDMISPYLKDSRRSDNQPIAQRVVFVLGDDAGAKFTENRPEEDSIGLWCPSYAGSAEYNKYLFAFGFLHHRSDLVGHGAAASNFATFKWNCSYSGRFGHGIYWDAHSGSTQTELDVFAYSVVPSMVTGLKQVQLYQ